MSRPVQGPRATDTPERTSRTTDPPRTHADFRADLRQRRRAWLRRTGRVIAKAAAVTAVLAAATWFALPLVLTTEGPLDTAGVDGTSITIRVGETGSWGQTVLYNRGSDDAVIESIRALDVPDGLEILQVLVAGADRKFLYSAATREWPDDDLSDLEPATGATIAPLTTSAGERGGEIVLVLRATKPGRYVLSRLEVAYRAGRYKHRRVVRGIFALCAATVHWRKAPPCDLPPDIPD